MHLIHKEIKLPDPKSADCIKVYFNKHFERRGSKKIKSMFESNRISLGEVIAAPEKHVLCFRPSNLRLDFDGILPPETRLLYSYWHGYLEKEDWIGVQDQIETVDGDFIPAHTSGHIYVEDIVRLVEKINARTVIPIHTFEPRNFRDRFVNVRCAEDNELKTI